MNFSFKKFLPSIMRDTKWGSLTEVWQSIYEDIRDEKIKIIFDQFDIEKASLTELQDLASMFGFNMLSLDGYTSTDNYLRKQILFLIPRIKTKTTQTCYQLQGIPYNLFSNGYSIIYSYIDSKFVVDETLQGTSEYGTTYLDRGDKGYVYYVSELAMDTSLSMDAGLSMDSLIRVSSGSYIDLDDTTLDAFNFPELDGPESLYSLTRNMAFSYRHKFIENETEFMSLDTLKALKNDINQFKKITDRCYYEPYIFIEVGSGKTETIQTWTDYEQTISIDQKSILIGDNLNNWKTIRFGTGGHTTIHTGIVDVSDFLFEWDYINDTSKLIESPTHNQFRTLMYELQHFTEITELAIIDIYGGCVLYSTFPKIQWHDDMYSNIKFDFQII